MIDCVIFDILLAPCFELKKYLQFHPRPSTYFGTTKEAALKVKNEKGIRKGRPIVDAPPKTVRKRA